MSSGNAVKAAAASGQIVRGIHLTFAAPTIIEILAPARLDFVYLDGEHGTFDWRDIEIGCITAERHGLTRQTVRVLEGQLLEHLKPILQKELAS